MTQEPARRVQWPWAVVIFLAAQTAAALIWGAKLDATVANLQEDLAEIKQSISGGTQFRYTSIDASRDKELMLTMIQDLRRRVDVLEKK